jgi:sRNA-binding carbon storage regulator CsrA
MLVSARKRGERIVATAEDGTRVEFRVLRVRGNTAIVGIEADRCVAVHRGEIQDLIDAKADDNAKGVFGIVYNNDPAVEETTICSTPEGSKYLSETLGIIEKTLAEARRRAAEHASDTSEG